MTNLIASHEIVNVADCTPLLKRKRKKLVMMIAQILIPVLLHFTLLIHIKLPAVKIRQVQLFLFLLQSIAPY